MKLIALLTGIIMSLSVSAQACTLFAAHGTEVAEGGSLIAKNRDYTPGAQVVKLYPKNDKNKYAVYALYGNRGSGPANICVGGVNEKGLAVMVAMASSIPKAQREAMPKRAIVRNMLSSCATVEEALAMNCLGPRFLMVADSKEIACIEIGENGAKEIKRMTNGTLSHTNHYLSDSMQNLNIRVKESSAVRYARIQELLQEDGQPYNIESFKSFCEDKTAGPNNSIWRVGLGPTKSQTLASFIVKIRNEDDFDVYLKYRKYPNEQGREKILVLTKQQIFNAD